MNVFVSWSGKRSRYIADTFHWWLPNVIQAVKPFISTRDIKKGTRGTSVIIDNLEASNVGIICLTPENQGKPWILFESGALSKLQSAHVCTFLYDLTYSNVQSPLSIFQHTNNNKEELFALCVTINDLLPVERGLSPKRLEEAFENWWPKLEGRLMAVPEKEESEKTPEPRTVESMFAELLEHQRLIAHNSDGRDLRGLLAHLEQLKMENTQLSHDLVRMQERLTEARSAVEMRERDRHITRFINALMNRPNETMSIEEAEKYTGFPLALKDGRVYITEDVKGSRIVTALKGIPGVLS